MMLAVVSKPGAKWQSTGVLVFILMFLVGCGGGSSQSTPDTIQQPSTPTNAPPTNSENETASVRLNPTFDVEVTTDVKYGEGLRHTNWNSENAEPMDLLLDLYSPENDEILRPVAVFIHGGGFTGGDKSFSRASDFMHFFAERGFVGVSINYRLQRDFGTIPEKLNDDVNDIVGLSQASRDQIKAIYPATRDAKAAIRWLYANQQVLGIDTDHITVIGGSAGSLISIALGVTEAIDFTDEISGSVDTSLSTVNTNMPSQIHTIIDHWGSGGAVELINTTFDVDRWDSTDAPVSIVHGTEDPTVLYEEAIRLREIYQQTGAEFAFYPLEGAGHGPWSAEVEGNSLQQLALDFVLQTQNLNTIE